MCGYGKQESRAVDVLRKYFSGLTYRNAILLPGLRTASLGIVRLTKVVYFH